MFSRSQTKWQRVFAGVCTLGILLGSTQNSGAQSSEKADTKLSESEKPSAATTADPELPPEYLELLVKPLTKDELVAEADGWRDLLKDNVRRISLQRIAVRRQQAKTEKAEAAVEKAEAVVDAVASSEPDPNVISDGDSEEAALEIKAKETAEQAEKAEKVAEERQQQVGENLSELTEEKALRVQQLEIVLDELEAKGGDVESYRQYVQSLTGVAVEVTDTTSFFALLRGWLTSEQGGQRWLWNIVRFIVILAAFYFGASIIAGFVRKAASRVKGASQLLVDFLGKFVKQLLMIVGLVVALTALEIDITPLLAAIGAAGFVVGFALQGTLSNFASGLLILAYRPFDVGDVIEASDVSGMVDSVSLFSTQIRTFDNKLMIVPNNDIWGGTITNATASPTRRVDMVFGIGYEDDVQQAQAVLKRLVDDHELILKDPAPVIKLHELADSSVNFVCRPWTKTPDYWTVYWDMMRDVKAEFDRNGISIPFPQRDVHVYQESDSTDQAK